MTRAPVRYPWSKVLQAAAGLLRVSLPARGWTFFGDVMSLRFPDPVSMFIHRYGFFEEGLTRIFLECVRPGMTVFDVGAHFGYFGLLAAELVGQEGQVHCFDPTPSTFELLRQNVAHRSNVHPQNLALYSREATLSFSDYGLAYAAFNSLGGSKLRGSARRVAPRRYDVQAVSLDHYVQFSGVRPDFVKIDAEGAEFEILVGAERTLAEVRPMLTLEVGDDDPDRPGESRRVVDAVLSRGYRAVEARDGRIVPHIPRDKYTWDNLLFLPQS
jgi:FkbM family methyltransferase